MFILKIISKVCNAENSACQGEETSELGHIGLLYCLSSHDDSQYDSLFSLASSYGDLDLLAQLVNTRSHLSINIMNAHMQANWDK